MNGKNCKELCPSPVQATWNVPTVPTNSAFPYLEYNKTLNGKVKLNPLTPRFNISLETLQFYQYLPNS